MAGLRVEQPDCERTADAPTGSGFEPPSVEQLRPRFQQLEILELLGRGGMGAVYKARQKELDRLVAVKILPPEVGRNPAFAERFTREARAMAKLSHPSIVTIHDFGQTEGIFYFVMEYVDGANLRQAMQAGMLQPAETLAIVPKLCEALQYAHDQGIVHRDIKPENVLVSSQGVPKIADFGLSKLLGGEDVDFSLTGTRQVMGTPRYMAPEQMQETKSVDHRADIYSLGVLFYELLTGELPVGRFDPPSKKVQVDVRLDEIVLRTLESEPARRYQQASDIKTDVERISTSDAATLSPPPPAEKATDAVYSRRLAWAVGGVWGVWAAILTIGLVGYLQGARWYVEKDDLLRGYWEQGFYWTSFPLAVFLALFWYTLAKSPDTRRSFSDFWTTLQTPDRRSLRLWPPMGVYLVFNLVAIGAAFAMASDAIQAITQHLLFIAAPLVAMASCVRAYGTPSPSTLDNKSA
jgi:tRNA A-37 threonylcarbamoyl transferase component Bud32